MKKKLYLAVITALISGSAFAGGLAEDEMDLQRELASTQNELEATKGELNDQKNRADDLEGKLNDLNRRIDDLASREPKVVENRSSYFGDSKVHGYSSSSYMDSNLEGSGDGTFHQEALNLTFNYELDDDFKFFANVAYLNGSEIYVDNGAVEGTGDLVIEEAWLDWKILDDRLIIKFGKFYTPVGVWGPNEIAHSTDTISNPVLVRWGVAPAYTTGMMLHGVCELGGMQLEKAIAIGNGKGFRPHSLDCDSDKALSARFGLVIPLGGEEDSMTLGLSGFYGEDGTYQDDHDEKIYAVDTSVNLGNFSARAELIKSRLNMGIGNGVDEDGDVWRDAWFAQLSYAIDEKWKLAYRHDYGDLDLRAFNMGELTVDTIGITYRPIEAVVFKLGYDFYDDDAVTTDSTYEVAGAQVAVVF